jgi:hypothetical protein
MSLLLAFEASTSHFPRILSGGVSETGQWDYAILPVQVPSTGLTCVNPWYFDDDP